MFVVAALQKLQSLVNFQAVEVGQQGSPVFDLRAIAVASLLFDYLVRRLHIVHPCTAHGSVEVAVLPILQSLIESQLVFEDD